MVVVDFERSSNRGSVILIASQPSESELLYKQGFIWMPDSLLLVMPSDTWEASVEVYIATEAEVSEDAYRALRLPFTIGAGGGVLIGSLMPDDDHVVSIPEGHYALIFEIGHKPYDLEYYLPLYESGDRDRGYGQDLNERRLWCRLTFIPQGSVEAAVLHQAPFIVYTDSVEDNFSTSYPLVLGTRPGQFTLTGEPIQP